MKKYLFILLFGVLCIGLMQGQTKSFKRGLGFNSLMTAEIQALSPGLSWVYNWGQTTSIVDRLSDKGIDFIPMAWSGINKDNMRDFLSEHPEIKYILAFNEPNFVKQANLTPQQAADKWPDIEEIADEFGLTIVGPALNHSPDAPYQDPIKWYDDFFAACTGCRVDHIALHFYMPAASTISGNIAPFKKYGKPIWLTEFCAYESTTTLASQKKLLIETLDYLETDPDIYRYAWFKERGTGWPYYSLLRGYDGELTELGEIFTYMSYYDDDYYFPVDVKIPAEQYFRMNTGKVSMEKTTDVNGHINLCGMGTLSWVDYNVDIPETGEYNVFFRTSNEYAPPDYSILQMSVNETAAGSITFNNAGAGVWETQKCKVNFQQGQQKVRLAFTKGGLRINWWGITKNEELTAVPNVETDGGLNIYPNPVKDILHLQTPNAKATLYDICGKCVYSGRPANSTIDMTALSSGMYILSVENNNGELKVQKILKED